jgi:hypothetical protein
VFPGNKLKVFWLEGRLQKILEHERLYFSCKRRVVVYMLVLTIHTILQKHVYKDSTIKARGNGSEAEYMIKRICDKKNMR